VNRPKIVYFKHGSARQLKNKITKKISKKLPPKLNSVSIATTLKTENKEIIPEVILPANGTPQSARNPLMHSIPKVKSIRFSSSVRTSRKKSPAKMSKNGDKDNRMKRLGLRENIFW
jgi:hypothetical protein